MKYQLVRSISWFKTVNKFVDFIIIQYTFVALRVWDKMEKEGKMSLSFTKIVEIPKEMFTDFLHGLSSVLYRVISGPDEKWVYIVILDFENADSDCKTVLSPLKAWSAPMDEWIRTTAVIDLIDYIIRQPITNNSRYENVLSFDYKKWVHLKCNFRHNISMISLKDLILLVFIEGMVKLGFKLMNTHPQEISEVINGKLPVR